MVSNSQRHTLGVITQPSGRCPSVQQFLGQLQNFLKSFLRFAALTANRVEVVRRLWSDEFDSNEPVKILGDTTGPPKAPNELVRIYRTSPSRVRPARQPDLRVEIRFPVEDSVARGR